MHDGTRPEAPPAASGAPRDASARKGRTVVLGLGNPLLSDDGVGLAVVAELQRLLERAPLPAVDVLASSRAGFELLDLLQGYDHAIVVDCLALPDPRPGRVRRLDLRDVGGSARLVNAHDISLAVAFQLAERLAIPMPGSVEILAVEAADTQTISEALTPAVQCVVEPLAREIYATLSSRAKSPTPTGSSKA